MKDGDILALARKFEQYPGSIEPTLRGPGVVEFARALIATREGERIADRLPVLEVIEAADGVGVSV